MSVRFNSVVPLSPATAPVMPVRQLVLDKLPAAEASAAPAGPPPEGAAGPPLITRQTGNFLTGGFAATQTAFPVAASQPRLSAASVSDKVIDRNYLFRALGRAMDRSAGVPGAQLVSTAAPLISGMRAGAAALPAFSSQPGQLEEVDTKSLAGFSVALARIDEQIKSGRLPAGERVNQAVQVVMGLIDPGKKLSPATRQALQDFLSKLPPDTLASAEVQGAGGAASGQGVTGSGAAGQYVNSVLSSLQQLNQTGRLTEKVLANLTLLTDTSRLQADLQPQQGALIRSALQDIAFPEKISQHAKATCAPTTAQILFAIKDPAAYVAVLAGLASTDGKGLPDGSIVREPGTERDDKSGRSLSNRLMQPALMEYANGELDYNNETDQDSNKRSGLAIEGTARLLQKLFPEAAYQHRYLDRPQSTALLDVVKQHTDKGTPISAGLFWGNDAHQILVTKIDPGKQLAYFMNPWGALQTMPLDEFTQRMTSAVLPETPGSPAGATALTGLPGAAGKAENYKALPAVAYRSAYQHLYADEVLGKYFSREQIQELGPRLMAFKVPPCALDLLGSAIKNFGLPKEAAGALSSRLMACATPEEALKTIRLVNFAQYAVSKDTLSSMQMQALLESHPEKHLSTEQFEALTVALNKPDRDKVSELAGQCLTAQLKTIPVTEQGAWLRKLITPAAADEIDKHSLEVQLGAQPETHLNPAEFAQLAGALAFGEKEGGTVAQTLLLKAYQAHLGSLSPEQAIGLIRHCALSSETTLGAKLVGLLRGDARMQEVPAAVVKGLSDSEVGALPLEFAKSLRQGLSGPEPRLDKAIKSGEEDLKRFAQAEKAATAAPAEAATPVESPSRAADKALQTWFSTALSKVDKLPPAKRQAEMVKLVMAQIDPGKKLDHASREAVIKLLQHLPLDQQLAAPETQGLGGEESSGVGITGTGKGGHYVNSMLTSLQELIKTGRMNKELAHNLTALSDSSKLLPALQGQQQSLMRSVLQDIAFPESINQHAKGTCAPTTVQILLALKDPGQYVKIVTGLASVTGKGTPDGKIVREPGTESDDRSGRSLASRLLQPALMEYGNGALDYNNTTDKHSDGESGLGIEGTALILRQLFPQQNYQGIKANPDQPDELFHKVKAQTEHGMPVSVGLSWGDSAHEILVTRLDETQNLAYFMNPWGQLQTMSLADFKAKLTMAALPAQAGNTAARPAMDTLPDAASRPQSYAALDPSHYYNASDLLQKDPLLKGFFNDAQRQTLIAKFDALDMDSAGLRYITAGLKEAGQSPASAQEITNRLSQCSTKEQAQQMLRLIGYASAGNIQKVFSPEQLKNLLDAFQGNQLTSRLDAMVKALDSGKKDKVREILAERYAQALKNQPADMRADFLNLLTLPKDPDARALAETFIKSCPDKSLSPAELGTVAAGIAMNNYSEPVAALLTRAMLAQTSQWQPGQAMEALRNLLQNGETEMADKLLAQIKQQGKLPLDQLTEGVLRGLDKEGLTAMDTDMLQSLRANLSKNSQDPAMSLQIQRLDQRIKEIEDIKKSFAG